MYDKKPSLKSNMEHSFARNATVTQERSTFVRPSGWKAAFDSDKLVPCYLDEVLPGDSMSLSMAAVIRTATPIHPIMDNLKVKYEAFFIPMRLVWENTEKFFGEQLNPTSSISFTIPRISLTLDSTYDDTLVDYMGLPVGNHSGIDTVDFSVLPLRCYHLIYDQWYRDQNLQDSADVVLDDTSGITNNGSIGAIDLHTRCKRPDYFTSGLPWPQKFEQVTIPLGDTAPVLGLAVADATAFSPSPTANLKDSVASGKTYDNATATNVTTFYMEGTASGTGGLPEIYTDLTSASSITVNELRQSIAIQHINEIYARSGSRYPEVMLGHFGVTSEDSRLQRPELLGIGSSSLTMAQVAQTSETGTTPQGSLSAYGQVELQDKLFTKSFTEHGFVMVIMSVVGDITYSQGVEKLWSRSTKEDFYWPSYNGIGEQAILSQEIYADGTVGDQDVFAYTERFGEYRSKQSQVTGLFRPRRSSNLAAWHLSELFGTRPTLGDTFIKSNTPMDRAIAVPSEPHYLADVLFRNKTARAMPRYSNPGLYRI